LIKKKLLKTKSHGPTKRRAKVKACGQKHRLVLIIQFIIFLKAFMSSLRSVFLTFLIKQKGKTITLSLNQTNPSTSSGCQPYKNKKARPGRTAGQRKGLRAEASFCLEFCFLLVKQKEEV
jgi:hypothetical protein